MSTGEAISYQKARDIAVAICYKLQPFTDKLNIAGSIRRQKAQVKDIEICCIPKMQNASLFGDTADAKPIIEFGRVLVNLGNVLKGQWDGRYMQICLPGGINLDLFMPQAHDYYRQYAIRTGSADYSAKVIAAAWTAKGWRGTDEGLRKITQCRAKPLAGGKTKWIPIPIADKPPIWASEEEFFAWLEVPYLKPQDRNI